MRSCIKCGVEKEEKFFVNKTRGTCKDCNNRIRREKLAKERANLKDEPKTCTCCKNTISSLKFKVGSSICKACEKQKKKERLDRKKKEVPKIKLCIKCDTEKQSNKFRLGENVCKECQKQMLYKWREENSEKFHAICKKYREKDENKRKIKKYRKDQYKNYPQDRAVRRLRTNLRKYLFIEKDTSHKKFLKYAGCSRYDFRKWISFNFKPGMDWKNYTKVWNLDHISPCSSFDLTKDEEAKKCFNWSNTAPTYIKDNLTKHDKVDNDIVLYYKVRQKLFQDPQVQQNL